MSSNYRTEPNSVGVTTALKLHKNSHFSDGRFPWFLFWQFRFAWIGLQQEIWSCNQVAHVEFGIRTIPFCLPLLPWELLDHRDWGIL